MYSIYLSLLRQRWLSSKVVTHPDYNDMMSGSDKEKRETNSGDIIELEMGSRDLLGISTRQGLFLYKSRRWDNFLTSCRFGNCSR
jgi:hypothetical protein